MIFWWDEVGCRRTNVNQKVVVVLLTQFASLVESLQYMCGEIKCGELWKLSTCSVQLYCLPPPRDSCRYLIWLIQSPSQLYRSNSSHQKRMSHLNISDSPVRSAVQ